MSRVQNHLTAEFKLRNLSELHPAFILTIVVPTCLAFSPIILFSILISYSIRWWHRKSPSLEKEFAKEVNQRKNSPQFIN